jgi:hypothetical protein
MSRKWTEADLKAAKARIVGSAPIKKVTVKKQYRSKLEAAFANYLDVLKLAKDIDGWSYEPVNFRLPGGKNFYKIDFNSWRGRLVTFWEVKGRNKSDDRSLVKLKTAAGLNPWAEFVQVRRIGSDWIERVM